jgi:hypothetical protein
MSCEDPALLSYFAWKWRCGRIAIFLGFSIAFGENFDSKCDRLSLPETLKGCAKPLEDDRYRARHKTSKGKLKSVDGIFIAVGTALHGIASLFSA